MGPRISRTLVLIRPAGSLTGTARVNRDRDMIDALWSDAAKAFFPKGKDDPNLVLLEVTLRSAEYWDGPSTTIGKLVTFVVARLTKNEEVMGENRIVDLLQGEQLPGLTRFVMSISKTMTSRLPLVLGGIALIVVLAKLFARLRVGRFMLDRLKLQMPIFGTLIRKTAIGRFTRTLGTLMSSGVPVLQALNIVRDTVANEVISRAVGVIHDSVKEGENMAPPIESTGVFPPVVVSMVEVGEETGALPEMLIKVADSYDDDVDNTVAGLTSIIEPILIIFLALVVGTWNPGLGTQCPSHPDPNLRFLWVLC